MISTGGSISWLGSRSEERELGVPLNSKLNMIRQSSLAVIRPTGYWVV